MGGGESARLIYRPTCARSGVYSTRAQAFAPRRQLLASGLPRDASGSGKLELPESSDNSRFAVGRAACGEGGSISDSELRFLRSCGRVWGFLIRDRTREAPKGRGVSLGACVWVAGWGWWWVGGGGGGALVAECRSRGRRRLGVHGKIWAC